MSTGPTGRIWQVLESGDRWTVWVDADHTSQYDSPTVALEVTGRDPAPYEIHLTTSEALDLAETVRVAARVAGTVAVGKRRAQAGR